MAKELAGSKVVNPDGLSSANADTITSSALLVVKGPGDGLVVAPVVPAVTSTGLVAVMPEYSRTIMAQYPFDPLQVTDVIPFGMFDKRNHPPEADGPDADMSLK